MPSKQIGHIHETRYRGVPNNSPGNPQKYVDSPRRDPSASHVGKREEGYQDEYVSGQLPRAIQEESMILHFEVSEYEETDGEKYRNSFPSVERTEAS